MILLQKNICSTINPLVLSHKKSVVRFTSKLVFALYGIGNITNNQVFRLLLELELAVDMLKNSIVFSEKMGGLRACKSKDLIDVLKHAIESGAPHT